MATHGYAILFPLGDDREARRRINDFAEDLAITLDPTGPGGVRNLSTAGADREVRLEVAAKRDLSSAMKAIQLLLKRHGLAKNAVVSRSP